MSAEQTKKVYVLTWKPNEEDDGSAHINNTFIFENKSIALDGAKEHLRDKIDKMFRYYLSNPKDLIQIELLLLVLEKTKTFEISLEELNSIESINNLISEYIQNMEKLVVDTRVSDSSEEQQLYYLVRYMIDCVRFYTEDFQVSFPGMYVLTEKVVDSIRFGSFCREKSNLELLDVLTQQQKERK